MHGITHAHHLGHHLAVQLGHPAMQGLDLFGIGAFGMHLGHQVIAQVHQATHALELGGAVLLHQLAHLAALVGVEPLHHAHALGHQRAGHHAAVHHHAGAHATLAATHHSTHHAASLAGLCVRHALGEGDAGTAGTECQGESEGESVLANRHDRSPCGLPGPFRAFACSIAVMCGTEVNARRQQLGEGSRPGLRI
jgi:hypothetical protein